MDYADILEKWAKYTKYDPNQITFNLNNSSVDIHYTNKRIEKILETYDRTGALAIIQAKIMFLKLAKNSTYNAYEFLQNPDIVKEDRAMWEMFHSDEVLQIEESYINSINKLSDRVIGKFIIGERNNQDVLNDLFEATDIVINSLDSCNRDLFVKGSKFSSISKISTHIHVFETLAECLTALDNTTDGLYLCYINCGGTANGYFGFFLKNNGNLLSINERVDEAYVGSHSHSRNGRWSEAKKYELFPYEYIFNYTNYDYKGYAKNHIIDEENLAFFELGHKVYLPLIIAMIMINNQYMGEELDIDVKYVDSLLPVNIKQISKTNNKIMIVNDNSKLLQNHTTVDLSFDLKAILNGDYSKEFDYSNNKNKNYKETGVFRNSNQIFVDLWGDGFEYSSSKLYETNSILRIGNSNLEVKDINPEFVGSKDRIRLQGYYQIRKQLADYIRDKIHDEWVAFGKTPAIVQWYRETINKNMHKIEKLILDKYLKVKKGEAALGSNWHTSDDNILDIYYVEQKYPDGWGRLVLNEIKDTYKSEYYCMKTGSVCNLFFTFSPKDWNQIEYLCGVEVPKIVKGWRYDGHFGDGNSILDATDLVTEVGTPFERYEANKYEKLYQEQNVRFGFEFAIGYSKRGINQLIKQYNVK